MKHRYRNQKFHGFVFVLFLCGILIGCGAEEKQKAEVQPSVAQMKSICELAVMDCYFHNVAKYNEEDATGIWLWKKDRNFWIEYAGVVRIGVDASLVSMEVEGDEVTITMPPAKVLSCRVDESTLTKDSFIVAKDSAKVEAEHEREAFKEAQSQMELSAGEDAVLLANAQQRAQSLLEDYVRNIGECFGKEYKVRWKYLTR